MITRYVPQEHQRFRMKPNCAISHEDPGTAEGYLLDLFRIDDYMVWALVLVEDEKEPTLLKAGTILIEQVEFVSISDEEK